jgi:hypothetical protein
MNGRLVLAQEGRVRRHVDDADSVENPSVGPLIDDPDVDIESGDIAIARGWC